MTNAPHSALPANLLNAMGEVGDLLEAGHASSRVAAAQVLLESAIELLSAVARETKDRVAETSIVDRLRILAGERHRLLTNVYNLDRWQRRLRVAEGLDEEGAG